MDGNGDFQPIFLGEELESSTLEDPGKYHGCFRFQETQLEYNFQFSGMLLHEKPVKKSLRHAQTL